jgi:hypothetical protein
LWAETERLVKVEGVIGRRTFHQTINLMPAKLVSNFLERAL